MDRAPISGDPDLEHLRAEIDAVDDRIFELVRERVRLATEIARRKLDAGLPRQDRDREAAILRRLAARDLAPLEESAIARLLEALLAECRPQ